MRFFVKKSDPYTFVDGHYLEKIKSIEMGKAEYKVRGGHSDSIG